MAEKKRADKKHDQIVHGLDKIVSGMDEHKDNQELMLSNMDAQKDNQERMLTLLTDMKVENQVRSSWENQPGAVNEEKAPVQETSKESTDKETITDGKQKRKKCKLSKEMPLEKLWAEQKFCDEFTKQMNVKYHKATAKHWPYLGEEFGIQRDMLEKFGSIDYPSPSESMFQAMERTKPKLMIKELCDALKKAKASKVLEIVNKAIEEKQISDSDYVSQMWDKSLEAFEQVVLNLDKNSVWEKVGQELGFTKMDCEAFERDMDPASNLTRDLFDVLRTQCPRLKVKDFEEKLREKKEEGVLKILEDNISGNRDMLLRKLSEIPNVMLDIEHILNDPKNKSLWQLAESFKRDRIDIDVEMFRHRGTVANPTYHLIEHVIASSHEELKIKHLMIHLTTLRRLDCLEIIEEYLEDDDQGVEQHVFKGASEQDNNAD